MAIGLLGAATGGSGTVYTVPSGISHAVVHITLSITAVSNAYYFVKVNSVPVLSAIGNASNVPTEFISGSVSMMLSPGDVVSYIGGNLCSCTISGYEVPL